MTVYSDKELQKLIKQYVHALQDSGVDVQEVWLHGAYASGFPTRLDFVELAIVTPQFKGAGMVDVAQKLHIALALMPQPCPLRVVAYHVGDMTPPAQAIRKSGRLVWQSRSRCNSCKQTKQGVQ